jgi:hypothetical protein
MMAASEQNKAKTSKSELKDVSLTPSESHQLLGICVELISLCSKITGKFDPSMGAMVAFARDEALTSALDLRS